MSNYIVRDTAGLFDPTTGQWVGVIDGNGQEHVVVPAGSKAVSAATSSDGGVTKLPFTRNPGGGEIPFEDLLPRHMPILVPMTYSNVAAVTNGVMTIGYDGTVGEFYPASIKIAASGAGSSQARIYLPYGTEPGILNKKAVAGGAIHIRAKCDDWSKVSRLYIGLTQDGGSVNYYLFRITETTATSTFGCTDPTYSNRWNNQWRTFVLQSKDAVKIGAPADWGKAARYFETDGISVSLISTAAVNIWINRIYSPDWPIGYVCPILDGAYKSAREFFLPEFAARGWKFGASHNQVESGGIYPSVADLEYISRAGHDVFPHTHQIIGSSINVLSTSVTREQFDLSYSYQRKYAHIAKSRPSALRFAQFLGNVGLTSGDTAGWLKSYGVNAARADCIDAEFGINPNGAPATTASAWIDRGAWAAPRGRFNLSYIPCYQAIPETADARDNYDYAAIGTLADSTAYAALTAQGNMPYYHQIAPGASTGYDCGVNFAKGHLSDLTARAKANQLLVLAPSEMLGLTYWRPGEVFLRWDNEWAYRSDPTTIAF